MTEIDSVDFFTDGAYCATRTTTWRSLQRLLDRTADIWIDEEVYGPPGEKCYRYLPTFILRGLTKLYIGFRPAERQD